MQSSETTTDAYLLSLPDDRKQAVTALYNVVTQNIPAGFKPVMQYGMITFVVPHSIYPKGYHCKPTDALPFLSIASQKNFIALYHMGIYADSKLLEWFTTNYAKYSNIKLDMGKSCMRFKKIEQIPFEIIGELVKKITPQQWIEKYEAIFIKKKNINNF